VQLALTLVFSDGGCGFGDAQPNDNAARALGFTGQVGNGAGTGNAAAPANTPPAAAAGNGNNNGPALNDNPPAGQGNGNGPKGNAGAAAAGGNAGAAMGNAGATAAPAAAAAGSGGSGATGAGNGKASQFITGPCDSDADCASGCCGFNSGKCAGPVIAQEVSLLFDTCGDSC
jgi:hypothetical protein